MSNILRLAVAPLILVLTSATADALDWIEQASRPGPDVLPVGQSRFDQLFLQADGRYRIPYPFGQLIADLEARLDNGDNPTVRGVFVPMGRSLQRDTPAPDYFRYPRRVIAVDGEPVTRGSEAGLVMEYRLFIAHQPKTESLEVISYNDTAGRFEFQVVDDYAAGGSPQARPANRLMCMSCHHNAAPIFSRTPWSETSFNVEVANRLVAALPQRYSSLIGLVTLDAGVIDVLAERANYLSAAQTVWQRGCASSACRAEILRAILQYRLSGESSFDWNSSGFERRYFDELSKNWSRNWPQGLALPGSRLADRNPFTDSAIKIEQDPLLPRPAQATWHTVDMTLARGIIYRLAGFFTASDIRALDRRLLSLSRERPVGDYRYATHCRVQSRNNSIHLLSCGEQTGIDQLQAQIEIEMRQDRIDSMRFHSLRLPRDSNLLQPVVVSLSHHTYRLEIEPGHQSGLSQRLANGDRLESIVLEWDDSLIDGESRLEVRISVESDILDGAIRALHQLHDKDGKSLAAGVFRRQALLQELMPLLGMQPLEWQTPLNGRQSPTRSTKKPIAGALALLEPYCAGCHGDDSRQPPGFLAGKDPLARIRQCAPRMLRRLRAWQPGNRPGHAPMPPPASIAFSGTSAADWPRSDHYRNLMTGLEALLPESQRNSWKTAAYDDLPACFAASDG
ncbi:MAG: hypothetical protein JSU67_11970 [Gammaproteobacteria bacterium]|nr:MAG: hypothetical protein JSU67_11970 [Gammaproteobacteria bacterium]